jgi:two-component system, NtrC family, sensor kinase
MKLFLKIFLLLLLPAFAKAQKNKKLLDSLHQALTNAASDTSRMEIYKNLGWYYQHINRDSTIFYAGRSMQLARQLNQKLDEAEVLTQWGNAYQFSMNYPKSLESLAQALRITQDPESEKNTRHLPNGYATPQAYRLHLLGYNHHFMGVLYAATGNINKEISSYQEAIKLAVYINDTDLEAYSSMELGRVYIAQNKLDSALLLELRALAIFSKKANYYEGFVHNKLSEIYFRKGSANLSRDALLKAAQIGEERNNPFTLGPSYISLSHFYKSIKKPDSSLLFAYKALQTYQRLRDPLEIAIADSLVSSVYSYQNKIDSAFAYLKLATALKDSLHYVKIEKLNQFLNIGFDEQMRLKKLEEEKIQSQTKIRTCAMLAGIGVFMFIAFLFYRINRSRKKANELLQKQKEEIEVQKMNVEHALVELKSTQSQLIQSEKMASLGELTAGIAHEIQNPLNFVNNFSEVNKELLVELKGEIKKGNLDEVNAIADDVISNEEKINHHGKRADAIVKGMLQHSRSSSGVKEPTNINALADEYLRLAYHGLRAKDKSFNATMKTDYDESIGNINIIPQDMGRVILNLITNAFYTVDEKKKTAGNNYEPTVTVSTSRSLSFGEGRGEVKISVKDNGNGIPQKILDKIFQPFFTTKPTGQGTGLGLSLSYDIVKAHGGELKVETKDGEGTVFIINLPIT